MIQETPQSDLFKKQLRDSLQHETLNSHAVKIARHDNVYTCGDQDEMVYFIENGQVKLLMLSPEGRNASLPSTGEGDIFGELCLSGLGFASGTGDRDERNDLKQNTGAVSFCPF